MEFLYGEVIRLREIIIEKDKEITKLQREAHKLKSVIEKSKLKRLPSLSSAQPLQSTKKVGVSGESWSEDEIGENEESLQIATIAIRPQSPQRHYKDFRTRQLIRSALGDNDFLKNLEQHQLRSMIDFMFPQSYSPKDFIIQEGETGSQLYCVSEGQLDVFQDEISLGTLSPGKAFGELALLYNCRRTASVMAITNCTVWVLTRKAFQVAMVKAGKQRIEDRLNFLHSVDLLKGLNPLLLAKIADCLEIENYEKGAYIIREGAVGYTFYIISDGKVHVTSSVKAENNEEETSEDENTEMKVLRELGVGDFFGEKSLLQEERRSANVVAISDTVECLTLDRESFCQLIGGLDEFQSKTLYNSSIKVNGENNESISSSSYTNIQKEADDENEAERKEFKNLKLDDLEIISTLGIGGFGRVELVQVSYDSTRVYALKCLPKANILATQQIEHVYSEKNILFSVRSPFIARLYKTFKDSKYVYFLMEACMGGEIWTILKDKGRFDEETSKFIIASVLLALEYLHERCIVYRDIKPENLMLGNDGNVKLVDFGFSKVLDANSSNSKFGHQTWTFCGTCEYIAPEVILNRGHDKSVDYYSVGILIFELLTGLPPWNIGFIDLDPLITYNQILKGIEAVHFPKYITKAASSLIRRLCRQIPSERLGSQKGIIDIMVHRWFQGFDWDGLRKQKLTPPIQRPIKGPRDTSNFDRFDFDFEEMPDDFTGWDAEF